MTNFHLNGVRGFLSNIANAVKNFATGVSNKKGGGTRSIKEKSSPETTAGTQNPPKTSMSRNLDSTQRSIAQNSKVQTSLNDVRNPQEKNPSDHSSKPSTSKIDLSDLTKTQIDYVEKLNTEEQKDWIDYYQEANNILRKLNDLPENAKQEITDLIHNFGNSENYNLEKLKEFSKLIDGGTLSEDELLQKAQEMFGNQTSGKVLKTPPAKSVSQIPKSSLNSTPKKPLPTPPQKQTEVTTSTPNAVTSSNTESTSIKNEELVATIHNLARKRFGDHRQDILDVLNRQNEEINDETFGAIFDNGNCSSAVKTALLLSNKVSLPQKQEILKSFSPENLAYAKDHEILNQIRWGITIGDNNYSNTQQKVGNALGIIIETKFFDENGQFTLPNDINDAREFFNPTTFTSKERQDIVKFLTEKKIQNPETDDDKFNNLKIDTAILMFSNDSIEKKCEGFNKIFNEITSKMGSFVENLPNTMNDDTKNKVGTMLTNCQDVATIINQFHSQAPEGSALSKFWDMSAGQATTRFLMPLNEILKTKTGNSIKGAKQEALTRATNQPVIQKAKYEVCKHYDNLPENEKKNFATNNKFYTIDTTGLELTQLCHKKDNTIETTPSSEIDVFNLNDAAMHQVATNLGLLEENEKFNIDKHTVKYGQNPILIDGKEATAQQIMDIVNEGKTNETKMTIFQAKRDSKGDAIINNGKMVFEKVEKTLADLIQ